MTLVGCGTVTVLLNGSMLKPRARRTQWGASAIHSVASVRDLAPASTLAAAAATIAISAKAGHGERVDRQTGEEPGQAHRVGQRLWRVGTGQLLQARRQRGR